MRGSSNEERPVAGVFLFLYVFIMGKSKYCICGLWPMIPKFWWN